MKATNAYIAKRALIDRLATLAAIVGHPLEGVQVDYARPTDIAERCIYGGGARFIPGEGAAEQEVLRRETVTAGLYVRVLGEGMDPRAAELVVEALGDVVAGELAKDPDLADDLSFMRLGAGSADFYPVDGAVEAILSLSVEIDSWLA